MSYVMANSEKQKNCVTLKKIIINLKSIFKTINFMKIAKFNCLQLLYFCDYICVYVHSYRYAFRAMSVPCKIIYPYIIRCSSMRLKIY